jgi:hypothetical protein
MGHDGIGNRKIIIETNSIEKNGLFLDVIAFNIPLNLFFIA